MLLLKNAYFVHFLVFFDLKWHKKSQKRHFLMIYEYFRLNYLQDLGKGFKENPVKLSEFLGRGSQVMVVNE